MDQRNVAGEQVRQLRQKESGAQIAHQAFIEKGARRIGPLAQTGHDRGIDRDVALAAAGGNDHVGVVEQFGIAGNAGIGERHARGIDADPLPGLHLPLIALFGMCLSKLIGPELMHDVGREALVVVGRRIAALGDGPKPPRRPRPENR